MKPETGPSSASSATPAAAPRRGEAHHSHRFLPLQAMVLLSPVVLLFGLPGEVFIPSQILNASDVEFSEREIADQGEDFEVTFLQLEKAAANEESRHFYEGKRVRLVGQFAGDHDKRFTLTRSKMTCCRADAIALNAIIMIDPQSPERLPLNQLKDNWVEVTGKVQFLKVIGKQEFVSSVVLMPKQEMRLDSVLKIIPKPANPFVN